MHNDAATFAGATLALSAQNCFAVYRGDIVGYSRECVYNPRVLVRSTVLSIICGAISRRRFGIEKSDIARCTDRSRRHGRSDHFYYAERKGWHFPENDAIYNGTPDDSEQEMENLERLRRSGATHFVLTRNTFWWLRSYPEFVGYLSTHATLIETTPEFSIYKLTVR